MGRTGKNITIGVLKSCKGLTLSEAETKTGFTKSSLSRAASRNGFKGLFTSVHREPPTKEQLSELAKTLTVTEAATSIGWTYSAIKHWVKKYELTGQFQKRGVRGPGVKPRIVRPVGRSKRSNSKKDINGAIPVEYTEKRNFVCQCGCKRKFTKKVSKFAGRLRFFSDQCKPGSSEEVYSAHC